MRLMNSFTESFDFTLVASRRHPAMPPLVQSTRPSSLWGLRQHPGHAKSMALDLDYYIERQLLRPRPPACRCVIVLIQLGQSSNLPGCPSCPLSCSHLPSEMFNRYFARQRSITERGAIHTFVKSNQMSAISYSFPGVRVLFLVQWHHSSRSLSRLKHP